MGNADPGRFNHLLVVMFENRSLDNLLGYLYQPGAVPRDQTFNGVAGGAYSNPVPSYIKDGHTSVPVRMNPGDDAAMSNPNPDPGEEYQHVNTQLYNLVDPPGNEFLSAKEMQKPWNAPGDGRTATMDGFVHDYCRNLVAIHSTPGKRGDLPAFEQYRVIMDCFGPESVPVISTLAREFAVYDAWHAAVPTQTFCNRSFFHASSSSGFVVNEPYTKWSQNDTPTIFNRLADRGVSWKVYYDTSQIVSLTGLIHAPVLSRYWLSNFASMETFYGDVKNGTLPAYGFIEPRLFWQHNDYHPPAPLIDGTPIGATSDVRNGELLLHEIYSAVRGSASGAGSNALNTLLLVTFDEHGGTYDHCVPPGAVPPDQPPKPGEFDFLFDRLGVRVPAIAISAWTRANTVISREVHHGTVIRSLCGKYEIPYLTERDRLAPDLSDALNLESPRDPNSWPVTAPRPVPPAAATAESLPPEIEKQALNNLQRHVVGLTMAVFNKVEPALAEIPKTAGEAHALISRLAKGAFGR
jgi:phospholipase C